MCEFGAVVETILKLDLSELHCIRTKTAFPLQAQLRTAFKRGILHSHFQSPAQASSVAAVPNFKSYWHTTAISGTYCAPAIHYVAEAYDVERTGETKKRLWPWVPYKRKIADFLCQRPGPAGLHK